MLVLLRFQVHLASGLLHVVQLDQFLPVSRFQFPQALATAQIYSIFVVAENMFGHTKNNHVVSLQYGSITCVSNI